MLGALSVTALRVESRNGFSPQRQECGIQISYRVKSYAYYKHNKLENKLVKFKHNVTVLVHSLYFGLWIYTSLMLN